MYWGCQASKLVRPSVARRRQSLIVQFWIVSLKEAAFQRTQYTYLERTYEDTHAVLLSPVALQVGGDTFALLNLLLQIKDSLVLRILLERLHTLRKSELHAVYDLEQRQIGIAHLRANENPILAVRVEDIGVVSKELGNAFLANVFGFALRLVLLVLVV